MRVLACNPDTIGDVVLRQPLYRAIIDAGHELTLAVRPLLVPVLGAIAPGASVIACSQNLYDPRLTPESAELEPIVRAAREARPDVLLVAPFQWTALEERLSRDLKDVRCVALSGRPFSDPNFGPARDSALRADHTVDVSESTPETRKNELLAGAVLGRALNLPDPVITPAPEHLAAADAVLAGLGLEAGAYWIACVGDSEYTAVRNWAPKRWAEVLSTWARERGRKFLLVGHQTEAKVAAAVREAMGDQAGSAVLWSGRGDGDLDVLIGLTALSSGYVGRDTGPMHLAAAMGKPVLAVFGGGTWPRFLPQVDPSVSLAVGVPCIGCGWTCHLPQSYCIKEVPVSHVLGAMDELDTGKVSKRTSRLLKPDSELLVRVAREGAAAARERLTELSVTRREHMEQNQSLAAVLERALKQAGRAEAIVEQLDAATAEFNRREALLKQRLAAAENTFRVREADLNRRIAELEAGAARAERAIQAEAQQSAREADLLARLAQAQEELARTGAELLQARAQASDVNLRLTRTMADQGTLSTLARQNEGEVVVLRRRLNELMASRWRRYGQRLGLCMTMPWEHEVSNGKH